MIGKCKHNVAVLTQKILIQIFPREISYRIVNNNNEFDFKATLGLN